MMISVYRLYSIQQSETAEERKARGHPIGQPCIFQAMGGLTGFSSLLQGMARMDPSGAGGQLSEAELDEPITAEDHPFLRAHAALLEAYQRSQERPERESKGCLLKAMILESIVIACANNKAYLHLYYSMLKF